MSGAAERYARVFAIVSEALELADAEHAAFLRQACAGDASLEAEVRALLAAGEESGRSGAFAERNLAVVRSSLEAVVDGATSDWLPERVGRYTIVRQLGQGGMGIVYEATQESPRRSVALKLLHPIHATPDRLRRFRHETELLGRLQHPGIVQVYEAGTYDVGRGPQPYFAMELVEGVDIRSYCEGQGLDRQARMELLARLCDAVQYAHEHGVVHRDIKPDNVLVNPRGWPRILDFGVAYATDRGGTLSTMLTGEGQLVGTLAYMAPEQLEQAADAATPQVDVYALGVLGFELLTGRLPREIGDLPVSKAVAVLAGGEPLRAGRVDPNLAGDVETMLGKAMESEPARRYASAAALSGDLRRHLAHQPIEARPPSRVYLMRKFTRRHRGLVAGALATLVTLLVGGITAVVLAGQARDQRDRALENERLADESQNQLINGILQSAQSLIDAGRAREAITQLRLVPEEARGVAWRLLDRAVPFVVDDARGRWLFLDDERIVGVADDRVVVYSLLEHRRVQELFQGAGVHEVERTAPCGLVVAYTVGPAGGVDEVLLLDLEREAILRRAPLYRGGAGRWPETSDDGRTLLWFPNEREAEVQVDGRVVRVVRCDEGLDSVRLGPDGRLLAVNRADEVTVLDLATGALRFRYAHDPGEYAAGLPVRGGVLLHNARPRTGRSGPHVWRRFDLERGDALLEPAAPFTSGFSVDGVPQEASCSRDGRLVATRADCGDCKGAYLGDAETGAALACAPLTTDALGVDGFLPFLETKARTVELSPSGRRLLTYSAFDQPRVVELTPRRDEPDRDPRVLTLRGHTDAAGRSNSGWVYHLAVSNDGSLIASSAPLDPRIRVWDARTGECVASLQRDVPNPVFQNPGTWESLMAFGAADDHLLVTTPYGGRGLCLLDWDLVSGEVALRAEPLAFDASHLLLLDAFIAALAPAGGARLGQRAQMQGGAALVAFEPPTPGLHEMEPPGEGRRWRYVPGVEGRAQGLGAHPGLPRVAVVEQLDGVERAGRLTLVDTRTGAVLERRELDYKPWCVAYSPDGRALAVGTNTGHVLLFETERHTQQLAWRAHAGAVNSYVHSIAWTPDGTRLVTASGDETMRVWDTRTRVASRLADERWRALRAEMAARPDLQEAFDPLTGDEREAARVELVRRAHSR